MKRFFMGAEFARQHSADYGIFCGNGPCLADVADAGDDLEKLFSFEAACEASRVMVNMAA